MGDKKVKGWTCEKPVSDKVEQLCLPTSRKALIPGYNYNTSTKIGLQYIPPPNDYFEAKPIPPSQANTVKDYRTIQRYYKTTSQEHDGRRVFVDPINQANRIGGTKCHFIKEFEEYIRNREVDNMGDSKSRYKRDFIAHKINKESSVIPTNISPTDVYCKVKGIAKNEQPKADITSPTMVGLMDIYLSTSKTDYGYISPDRREFFIAKKENFAVKKEKDPSKIFEEGLFRIRHLNRTVPKFVARVPNSGIITENQGQFKDFWGICYKRPAPVYDTTIQMRATASDIMKIPAMYKTEYSHYGSKISPIEIV